MGGRKRVVALALIMLFFFPLVLPVLPSSADGESWLLDWAHRKSHTVFSAPDAGANYQVKIIVHYGSGTDIGESVYCNSHCRTDFGDIRFTDNDGITLLDYWMEEKTDSVSATFWVKISDDLSLISANIYIYYGNSVATTTSDGDATFLEFTHFEDMGLPGDWEVKDNDMGSHSVFNSKLIVESDTVSHGTFQHHLVGPTTTFNIPCRIRAYVTSYAYYSFGRIGPTFAIGDLADRDAPMFHDEGHSVAFKWDGSTMLHVARDDTSNMDYNEISDPSTGIWELLSDTTHNRFHVDDSLFDSADDYSIDDSLHVYVGTASGWSSSGGSRGKIEIDWLFVSKFVNPEPLHSSWGSEESNWLPGWGHRKSHVINPGSGAGTNYQTKIVVYYGSGTDSGENAYCGSQCRTDFGDIRFTDGDGLTELDYWLEAKVDSNYGIFWVEVADDLSTSSTTIYMYYGNSTATTTSNGENTFLFFDDFSGASLDPSKWNTYQDPTWGSISVSGGEVYLKTAVITIKNHDLADYTMEYKARATLGEDGYEIGAMGRMSTNNPDTLSPNNTYYFCGDTFDTMKHTIGRFLDGQWTNLISINNPISGGPSYIFSNKVVGAVLNHTRYSVSRIQQVTTSTTDNYFSHGYAALRVDGYGGTTERGSYYDWVFIRKSVAFEPSHGTWGDLPPQDGQQDSFLIIVAVGIGAFAVIGIAAFLKARSPRPEVAAPEPRRPIPEPTHEEEIVPEEITPEREEVEAPEPVLPSDILCSYCGYANPAGAKYCIRCGRHLE